MKRRTKEFFIRVIILVAKATSTEEIKALLTSIFIVSLSETEGVSASTHRPTPCETNKKELLAKIAGYAFPDNLDHTNHIQEEDADAEGTHENMFEEENDARLSTLRDWINTIECNAKKSVLDDGDRDNIMHHPQIVQKFKHLLLILPLWTSALPRKLNSPYLRSVGAYVESEIGNLKTNLLTKSQRVDDFVKEYLEVCDGAIKIASSIGTNTVQNTQTTAAIIQTIVTEPIDSQATQNVTNSSVDQQPLPCPVCLNGDQPGGAHRCVQCIKPVHSLELCSKTVDGEEEGYGQKRICLQCLCKNSKPITQKYNTNSQKLIELTSIIDRSDITNPVMQERYVEPTAVEGWRGLSLPPKKKTTVYYWRTNPDFPLLLTKAKSTKLGVLKNGMDPTLKIVKLGATNITLSNTCSFDAPCQIFATAYCDSVVYRERINYFDPKNTLLDVAKCIATTGIKPSTYKKRASVLATTLLKDRLRCGVVRVNCAMDSSHLLRQTLSPPTVTERYTCSSPYCSAPNTEREVVMISVVFDKKPEEVFNSFEEYLVRCDTEDTSLCMQPLTDVTAVPDDYFYADPKLSTKVS